MKYKVEVMVHGIYEAIVEAKNEEEAEKLAEDMEYDQMREIDNYVTFAVIEEVKEDIMDVELFKDES